MIEGNSPSLSIIVPVYNVEAYVSKCLSSLELQTYTDFEVLMIDDGSTDNSGVFCKEWEKKITDSIIFTNRIRV